MSNNKVRVDRYRGGWAIYCFNVNRYYSRINSRNNEYIPIVFDTKEAVIKECNESEYLIVNPMFDMDDE